MTTTVNDSFEQMVERLGKIRAMDTFFGSHGYLPPETTQGEYWEALGDKDLGEDVEMWIKSNCSR